MGNGCTFKGQSDAPVVDEDGGDRDKRGQQPKGKQIRVVLVDSDCTDSEVDEAVKRILKGGNPVGGKKKKNNDNDNSSAFDSSSASEAPSSAASPTSPVSEEPPPPELIAKGVPIKKKKLLLKMGKKGRKVGKQSKSKSGKSASKKKSMSTPLSSLASSANASSVDSSSVNSSVQPPPLIKQPAKVTQKEIIKSTGPPPSPAKTKTKNADSTFFSSPLRLPSDSEQENSSIAEEKGKQLHLKESTQIQSSDDGGGGGSSSSDNANDAHTH